MNDTERYRLLKARIVTERDFAAETVALLPDGTLTREGFVGRVKALESLIRAAAVIDGLGDAGGPS